jgi:hypothetical protein
MNLKTLQLSIGLHKEQLMQLKTKLNVDLVGLFQLLPQWKLLIT